MAMREMGVERSIPACAGEPVQLFKNMRPREVYPRVCGGTSCAGDGYKAAYGLSPRVRGNLVKAGVACNDRGSIPACAGEPFIFSPFWCNSRVYPRVCGGTSSIRPMIVGWCGLSPRVRGNPCNKRKLRFGNRSIPACAGEPSESVTSEVRVKVYPRVCGGTMDDAMRDAQQMGLSPRVRGNHVKRDGDGDDHGSIPACAGEPLTMAMASPDMEVYPRVCGGTSFNISPEDQTKGLSPRVRGNLDRHRQRARRQRSIPACAGEP